MYDIAVIGGGVIGGAILKELSKYNAKTIILEKSSDVCCGQSRANSGIVHAGFDAKPNSLKAKFNVEGNSMMKDYAEELGVKYKNNGSLVVAFSESEITTLNELSERGVKNGVKNLSIIDGKKLREIEPNISEKAVAALYAESGGIVCPYELTIAAIGNAMDNGAELKCEFEVAKIEKTDGRFILTSALGDSVEAKTVINCAGAGSEKIAKLCGDNSVNIGLRRGEYILLDRESGSLVSHTLFFCPTEKGKGILVSNTVDGNIILGPTAEEIEENDVSTTEIGLNHVKEKASEMIKSVPFYNTITSFAGVRAYSKDRHDFIIEKSKTTDGLINVCGIESPGLTSAPAIAKYVVEKLVPEEFRKTPNVNFNPRRTPDDLFKTLSTDEKNKIIMENPSYGNIVCRCEQVSEGEIVEAIRRNPKARTIDAVKRRTRSGMGRCQGGFCSVKVTEILARELNIPIEEVNKNERGSNNITGVTK